MCARERVYNTTYICNRLNTRVLVKSVIDYENDARTKKTTNRRRNATAGGGVSVNCEEK